MLRMAVVLAFVIACKGGDGEHTGSHTFHIKRDLKTESTKTTGILDGPLPTPMLVVDTNGLGDAAMKDEIAKFPLASKGSIKVLAFAAIPSSTPHTRNIDITVHATFFHPPQLTTVDAKITGTLTEDGATSDDIARDLGSAVVHYLESEKLPAGVMAPGSTPVPKAVSVTVGEANCSLHEDKSVRCWSLDFRPTLMPKLAGTKAVEAGNNYGSCGIRGNGRAYCIDAWSNELALADRDVCGVEDATAISAGQEIACAIVAGGEVRCWGRNPKFYEPCGAGKAPKVKDLLGAVALDVGPWDACAVLADGNLSCWKLGKDMAAKKLAGITKATQVIVGFEVCALVSGDKIRCVSKPDKATKPHEVTLPEAPKQLAYGPDGVTCALGAAGHVYCWNADSGKPAIVDKLDGVTAIGGDLNGLCAVRAAGDVVCWEEMGGSKAPKSIKFPM